MKRPKQSKPQIHISSCTRDYAMTLANPFDVHGKGLTCTPVIPSLKQNVFIKGTFQTGTASGFGFLMADPFAAVAGDINSLWTSTAATAVVVADIADANTQAAATNSAYTAAQISGQEGGIVYRVVSAGIRLRYTGTTLNQGGTIYSLSHPNHSDMNQSDIPEVRALNVSKNHSVDRDWISALWCPVLPNDYGYTNAIPGINIPFIHLISVPTGTSLSFEYEFQVNFELVGAPIRGMTPSHADAVGFAATQSALQGTGMVVAPRGQQNHQSSLLGRIENNVLSEASHVGQYLWDHRWNIVEGAAALLT